uniref:Sentrin-specific protease 7 n=1 Tax=Melanaphis sacchari TaxID=742174 RepID=A0A2H8TYN3_9HEMI
MFTVGVKGGGSPWVVCNLDQLIEIFPSATLSVTFDELRETFKPKLPPGADLKDYCGAILLSLMDPVTKKVSNPVIMPMHHNIFNNPNISITPSSPLPKQPPIAAASRPPWTVPVSPPVSIVPVPCEPDKLVTNSKETQKNPKRTAPYQISNRTIKQPRLSITKPTNARKDYKSSSNSITLKTHQLKKNDKAVANIDLAITTPSTSNAVIQSTEEVACVQSIKEDLQATNSELNCKDNSPRLDNDKKENGFHRRYCFSDNHFKMYDIGNKKDDSTNLDRDSIEIRTHGEIFEIKKSFVTNELIIAMGTALKKNITDEDFDSLHKTSSTLQSSKFNWSSVTSNISMKSPTRQNNINSINQPNQVGINKSQKQTIISQQPSKQTIKSSSISKQQSTSTNTSSKIQHSTINKTDLKNHVSNNQHNNTSLKHTKATATHIQTSNKQITNSNQLPISSKLVSTTRKLVNLYNVKPAITHQSSVKDIKKCLKCKALSEDETCAACRMSSHLKNVTVTRIETPSTSAVVALESPIVMHSKPIDVPLSSINPVSPQEPCVLLLSSGDEDEEESLEPNITKIETKEALKKHTDKLCLNPKLLEDRLWQKDLSVKDYYKIEECYTVHIGSFKTAPTPSGDMLVCLHGIRMTVQGLEPEPVTIDLPMDNVVKILGYYGENPLLIIYTNHLAAVGIQYLLNMNEDDKSHLYDPLSKDITVNKIVWFFNLKRPEIQNLEKLLLKLSKRKYAALTFNQANKILCLKKKDDEESKILAKEEQDEAERKFNSITILEDKLGERSAIIKICDYRMLNSNEFVNDILIEFYLDYWYSQKLSDEDRNRTYVFSTYFYTTLAKSFNTSDYPSHFTASQIRHEKVKKWTKNVDIFKKDFIFIPINENYHWFMAVICFPYLSGKVNIKDGKPVNAPDDNYGRYKLQQIESTAADRIEADPNVEDLWLFDLASTQNYTDKRGVDYDTDVAVLKKNRNILVKRPCILLFDSFSGGVCRARITATLRDWLEQEYIAKYNDKKKRL